jgi:hypothetical protein
MVQRTAAGGISRQGRSATGVRVMNLKDDDVVSAVALVVDSGETDEAQGVQEGMDLDDARAPELAPDSDREEAAADE